MSKQIKQLSSSFSTGGAGNNFETDVQSAFITLMLVDGFIPCMPSWPIKKIKLQGKYAGYNTDDLIIFIESCEGKNERKLLCQIKRSITVGKNKDFREVIQAAWVDFNNTNLFTEGKDSIALITGMLSDTDIKHVRPLFDRARLAENATDYFTQVNLPKYVSPVQGKKLGILKELLDEVNGAEISDDNFFRFMRSYNLLGYDLDIKSGVTLSLLQSLLRQHSTENAQSVWSKIVCQVRSYNQNSGTIQRNDLPDELLDLFKKPSTETIPEELFAMLSHPITDDWNLGKLVTALLFGGWNEKR
jgi:hypothetical protein